MNDDSRWQIHWVPICMAFLALVMGWCFAYFWHYHSQSRSLAPDDYYVSVYSAQDYAQRSVSAERYKKIFMNGVGDTYVKVSLKGTASAMPVVNRIVDFPMLILLMSLVIPVWRSVRDRSVEKAVETDGQ